MILVLGGTAEGRELADYLAGAGYETVLSVASQYGAKLAEASSSTSQIICGPLDALQMVERFKGLDIDLILDASHPFAFEVTANANRAAAELLVPYLRFKRPGFRLPRHDLIRSVTTFEHAAEAAATFGDVVFLGIGSNHLEEFLAVKRERQEVVVRVLPVIKAVEKCLRLGVLAKNIIAAQGPFSVDFNIACFKEYRASVLVTKNSGSAGGIEEKIAAAIAMKLPAIVVERRDELTPGFESYDEIIGEISRIYPHKTR